MMVMIAIGVDSMTKRDMGPPGQWSNSRLRIRHVSDRAAWSPGCTHNFQQTNYSTRQAIES